MHIPGGCFREAVLHIVHHSGLVSDAACGMYVAKLSYKYIYII